MCARLLINNLGKQIAGYVFGEEFKTLRICEQGVLQLRFGRRDKGTSKGNPLNP